MTAANGSRIKASVARSGPRTHKILDFLAGDNRASYKAAAVEYGLSKAAVGKAYRGRERHRVDTWPLVENGQPSQSLTIECCFYCGAWRRWRTAGDGKRYVTEWEPGPPPNPAPAHLNATLEDAML